MGPEPFTKKSGQSGGERDVPWLVRKGDTKNRSIVKRILFLSVSLYLGQTVHAPTFIARVLEA